MQRDLELRVSLCYMWMLKRDNIWGDDCEYGEG